MIYLAFDSNETADRGLEPGKLRLMRRQTVNMATMRNSGVIPDKFGDR